MHNLSLDFIAARNYITTLEDIMELKTDINFSELLRVCNDNAQSFTKYHEYVGAYTHSERYALPLITNIETGSFFPLHKFNKNEMDFTDYTPFLQKMTSLVRFIEKFNRCGRSHVIKMMPGSFFPPHRDGPNNDLSQETFRLLITLSNCTKRHMAFVLDDKVLPLQDGRVYFINTYKTHFVSTFNKEALFIILNIHINMNNFQTMLEMVP